MDFFSFEKKIEHYFFIYMSCAFFVIRFWAMWSHIDKLSIKAASKVDLPYLTTICGFSFSTGQPWSPSFLSSQGLICRYHRLIWWDLLCRRTKPWISFSIVWHNDIYHLMMEEEQFLFLKFLALYNQEEEDAFLFW